MTVFTNKATLSFQDTTRNSNIAFGELLDTLAVSKLAVLGTYRDGGTVTYAVSIRNSGPIPFTGLTVTDNLGAYSFNDLTLTPLNYMPGTIQYYVGGVLQTTAPAVDAGPPLLFSGIDVPSDGNVLLIYEAQVNSLAPLDANASIRNEVTVDGGGLGTPLTAAVSVHPEPAPNLTVSKSIHPGSVTENSQVTYTFLLQNSGNTAAVPEDNAIIRDTFAPILSNLSVTFNGAPWDAPANYTYNGATGAFATSDRQIEVPPATYAQDPTTGIWIMTPGVSTLSVTGIV